MIFTPGEKLKYIRRKYSITQKELANDIISTPMIGKYEKGKCKIKGNVAKLICSRLNEIILDPDFNITSTELLLSEEEQIVEYVDNLIANIQFATEDNIKELQKIFIDYSFDSEKLRSFFALACFFQYKHKKEDISLPLFEDILSIALETQSFNYIFPVILNLQRIHLNLHNYELLIKLYKKTYTTLKTHSHSSFGLILYNFALAFHKNNAFDKGISLYLESIPFLEKSTIKAYALNNIATCYSFQNKFELSNQYFIQTVDSTNNQDTKLMCYSNMIINYVGLKQEISVKNCINKLETLLSTSTKGNKKPYQKFYCIGKGYLFLNDRYQAMKSFEKEISLGISSTNNHFYIRKYEYCIEELVKIYSLDINKLKQLEKYFLDIPSHLFNPRFYFGILKGYNKAYSKKEMNILLGEIHKKLL